MWFASSGKTEKRCFPACNRVIWFMNRNNSLKQKIVWHKMPDASPSIATFTDDGTLPTSELLEVLSLQENEHAATLHDPVEHRHYIARRCFQRLFVSQQLSINIAPDKLALIHRRDTRPQCADAPGLNLSFSSSGTTAIACASAQYPVGIDIERLRKVENAPSLARRYFNPEEAEALENLPNSQQSLGFLHYWTAKEAGLKAIGKGIVFGLNTFSIKDRGNLSFDIQGPQNFPQDFNLAYLDIKPKHLIALVKMNRVEKI